MEDGVGSQLPVYLEHFISEKTFTPFNFLPGPLQPLGRPLYGLPVQFALEGSPPVNWPQYFYRITRTSHVFPELRVFFGKFPRDPFFLRILFSPGIPHNSLLPGSTLCFSFSPITAPIAAIIYASDPSLLPPRKFFLVRAYLFSPPLLPLRSKLFLFRGAV